MTNNEIEFGYFVRTLSSDPNNIHVAYDAFQGAVAYGRQIERTQEHPNSSAKTLWELEMAKKFIDNNNTQAVLQEFYRLSRMNRKIMAIKELRSLLSIGLLAAKQAVEWNDKRMAENRQAFADDFNPPF